MEILPPATDILRPDTVRMSPFVLGRFNPFKFEPLDSLPATQPGDHFLESVSIVVGEFNALGRPPGKSALAVIWVGWLSLGQ